MTQIGKYLVVRELGRGGMGVVYEARDPTLDRPVAIKLVTERGDPERFLREARAAARVIHPNCVPIFDMGEHEGTPYLVMELVVGQSAAEFAERRGPLKWKLASQIVASACRGLAAVHDAGLVHRDIKPSNLLLSKAGGVKVADFGLARAMGASSNSLTGSRVVGTPHFMSPEQCHAEPVDARSDIYSLGATYYVLLTNKPPFRGDHDLQVMFAHCNDAVPDPRAVVPDLPDGCAEVVRKAMAKAPSDRFRTAREMLAALEAVIAANPTSAQQPPAVGTIPPPRQGSAGENEAVPTATPVGDAWGPNANTLTPEVPTAQRPKPVTRAGAPAPTRRRLLVALPLVAAASATAGYVAFRKKDGTKGEVAKPDDGPNAADVPKANPPPKAPVLVPVRSVGGTVGVCGLAVSDDGRWLAVGMTEATSGTRVGGVKLYDRTRGNAEPVWWNWREEGGSGVAFSPDGRLLAVACGGTSKFRVWSMPPENREVIFPDSGAGPTAREREFRGGVVSVSFSSDGKYVAAGVERWADGNAPRAGFVRVWDVAARAFVRDIECPEPQPVRGIAFIPGGHTLVAAVKAVQAGQQPLVEVWDAASGATVKTIKLTTAVLGPCVAFARREPLLAITYEHAVDVRRASAFAEPPLLKTASEASSVAITPGGEVVAAAIGDRIDLCDLSSRSWRAPLLGHRGLIGALAVTADGKTLISGASDREVREWPL